ncbi:alcohol dehydrogenase [Aspergillus sclerotioniger CBS 115572]|uniref:D-xylulose reductase n=1 Tax=Aspergillus sclerotioniger CBS 115572 TaxID=1450535 RepID=A0A317W685_9EURO|nr:alcohol dehydrogenase [Aspergillus sclerotioniger CBS 115572]PWY80747.1 alcohol dehydrogenase [Aspergillus sclerotioniger CBS 115572]
MASHSPHVTTMINPSCLLYGPGDARYEDRPIPIITSPTDVIIRIAYTGVCGSDVHFWHHGGIKRPITPNNPITMGHEASGIVHAIGSDITTLSPGDRLALEPGYACHRCNICKSGHYNLCPRMKFAGVPTIYHGTLTRFFKLPVDCCYRIPDSMGLDEATLMEPLGVAVHSVREVGVGPGMRVCVFGAGTVGVLCMLVAREFGADGVVGVDMKGGKLGFAGRLWERRRGLGGGYILDGKGEIQEEGKRMLERFGMDANEGEGFDIVIEATGAEPCMRLGVEVLKVGGRFMQTGLGKRNVTFPIGTMAEKEIMLKGCFRYGPGDFALGVQFAVEGRFPLKRFITKVVGFEKAVEAWETTARGEGMKTLIRGVDMLE